jgi:hypothetical protein
VLQHEDRKRYTPWSDQITVLASISTYLFSEVMISAVSYRSCHSKSRIINQVSKMNIPCSSLKSHFKYACTILQGTSSCSTHSAVRRRPPIRLRRQPKPPIPRPPITNPTTTPHSTSLMQPISTLTHRSANSLTRSSRIAIQTRRDRLISETLPDFAVEVRAIHQCA